MLSDFIFLSFRCMKVGSFRQTQERNRNAIHRKGLRTSSLLRPEWMATAMTGKFVPWRGRVLTEAGLGNWREPEQSPQYSFELLARDREVLDSAINLGEPSS